MKFGRFFITSFALLFVVSISTVHAYESVGRIDPKSEGRYLVKFLHNPGTTNSATDLYINFGRFDNQKQYNITIDDDGFHGYAWSAISGWILMNCETVNGCSSANGNFKVDVEDNGNLSGYAWGESMGWINFGPFPNSAISRVTINDQGEFGGTLGDAGYAWSSNFGWIVFDCSNPDTCVKTDYTPIGFRSTQNSSGGNTNNSNQCNDAIDNDNDGVVDSQDPQCSGGSKTEFSPYVPPAPVQNPPQSPQTPPQNQNPTPVRPNTPVFNPSTTDITDDDNGEGEFVPTETTTEEAPNVIPVVTETVTHVIRGDIGLPQAKDQFGEVFHNAIAWVKSLVDSISDAIERLMQGRFGTFWAPKASIVGISLLILSVLAIAIVVPLAAGAEFLLYPQYFIQNTASMLGLRPRIKPWGIIYDTTTFQPLPLARVALHDASGKVVTTTISNPDGSFAFRVPAGVYTASLDSMTTAAAVDSTAAPLFGPLYTPGEQFGVADNVPSHPFSIGVKGQPQPPISGLQQFVLNHEVAITNISLVIFGAGMLAALLNVIFHPTIVSAAVLGVYIVMLFLRTAGLFGAYASVFVDKVSGLPLAGKLIQIFDTRTKTEVVRTLTSQYGRAYFDIPRGYYYSVVSDPSAGTTAVQGTTTASFAATGGLHQSHFTV